MKVRLTRKLAERFNGIDLKKVKPGDFVELPAPQAEILLAAGWAITETAADHSRRRGRRPAQKSPRR